MNATEARQKLDWGWTSYKRCGWALKKDGRRLYSANWRTVGSAILGFTTLYIQFYAKRPILALKLIAESGRDPNEFNGKVVN